MDISLKDIFLCVLPVIVAAYYERKKRDEERITQEIRDLKQIVQGFQEQEQERAARQEELIAMFEQLHNSFDKMQSELGTIREGLKASLRDRIVQSCTFYTEKQGWVPPNVYGNISKMYHAYRAMGGNDVATRFFDELSKLPMTQPEGIIT